MSIKKKSQYNIIYLIFVIAISIGIFGGIYALSNYVQDLSTEKFGYFIIDGVFAKIRNDVLEMRIKTEETTSVNITKIISVPSKIGVQQYQITAENSSLTIKTYGNPALTKKGEIGVWQVNITGFAFSASGKIELVYSPYSNRITLK